MQNSSDIISDEEDSSSYEEDSLVSEEISEESETVRESLEIESSNIVDDTYYGNGYSFSIPNDFFLVHENEREAGFINEENFPFYISTVEMSENVKPQTEEGFRATYGSSVTAFEETTIDGEYSVYGIHTYPKKGVEVSQAIYNIYTDELSIVILFSYADDNTKKALEETMDSFMID
jgi:hypothetical protein